jgi:hypothetical protein
MNITNEESEINQLVGEEINPIQMVEAEGWLYLNDPKHGLFVFDWFGTYSKLIPIKGIKHFQVRANGIFLHSEVGLHMYNPLNFEQTQIELPVKEFRFMRIEKDLLYILADHAVLIYRKGD